jgi:hypothetical protein
LVTLRTVVGSSSETETLRRRVTETLGSEVVRLWTDTPSRRDSVLTPTLPPLRVLVPTLTPLPELVLDPALMPVLLLDPVDPDVEFWA